MRCSGSDRKSSFLQEIEEKLRDTTLDEKEKIKLELEKDEIKKQEEEYLRKEKELEDKERLEPWNVDTIGHEAFSATVVFSSCLAYGPEFLLTLLFFYLRFFIGSYILNFR